MNAVMPHKTVRRLPLPSRLVVVVSNCEPVALTYRRCTRFELCDCRGSSRSGDLAIFLPPTAPHPPHLLLPPFLPLSLLQPPGCVTSAPWASQRQRCSSTASHVQQRSILSAAVSGDAKTCWPTNGCRWPGFVNGRRRFADTCQFIHFFGGGGKI